MSATEVGPAIRELRALETELKHPRGQTAASILDYIAERRARTANFSARNELKPIAERLREHRNLDYALDDVREALAAVFFTVCLEWMGWDTHQSVRLSRRRR